MNKNGNENLFFLFPYFSFQNAKVDFASGLKFIVPKEFKCHSSALKLYKQNVNLI